MVEEPQGVPDLVTAVTRWRWPLLLASWPLLALIFPERSPVLDAVTLQPAAGYALLPSFWHLVLTPFSTLADSLTVLSERELLVTAVWILVAGLIGLRGWRRQGIGLAVFVLFAGWGALWPRPMARLVAADPNVLLIDFHSHTSVSHDGRASFGWDENRLWHERQGYGAGFITDHNRSESAQAAFEASQSDWRESGYRSLRGEEISLYKTHLVVLGNTERIDNAPFDGDPARVESFIKAMRRKGLPVIASLPEYWRFHEAPGSPGGTLDDFIRWGVTGIEIVNSAPKALDFPLVKREAVAALARTHNLYLTGISDNHGYGRATAAWNAVRLPGWRDMDPQAIEKALLGHLSTHGYEAVQVLERAKFKHRSLAGLLLSPVANLWIYGRTLLPIQAGLWAFWILAASYIGMRAGNRNGRKN